MESRVQLTNDMTFVVDIDGVLTNGLHYYDSAGKVYKGFGSGDKHAIQLAVKRGYKFLFLTGDKNGYDITRARFKDIGLIDSLARIDNVAKLQFIKDKKINLNNVIYIGDDIYDIPIFNEAAYSATPINALPWLKDWSFYISEQKSGEYFLADCIYYFIELLEGVSVEDLIKEEVL